MIHLLKTIKENTLPIYEFVCKNCDQQYDEITSFDPTGKYKSVKCPHCKSKKKEKLVSACGFAFADPVGTGKWNNESTGHDYRFKHNIPKVKKERETAEKLSHMGPNPYNTINDL
jgi:putative FmdB family regulatory protein